MNCSLNTLYGAVGISKQAVHKYLDRQLKRLSLEQQLHLMISKIRRHHPRMGVRELYFKIGPEDIGRDAFEKFCKEEGYSVGHVKNYRRTTDSLGVTRFTNQIKEMKVNDINQLWQSDITYYEVGSRFFYITLIQDAFSKMVLGHQVSSSLTTEQTTLPALRMALKRRRGSNLRGLVFHSDGGGQYYDKKFLELTGKHEMINSMCTYPWENGMAESLNGVIKNNYLRHRQIRTFVELQEEVDRTISLYNHDKPHSRLKRKNPVEFEQNLVSLKSQTEAMMTESFDAEFQMKGASGPIHLSQTKAQNQDVISAAKN